MNSQLTRIRAKAEKEKEALPKTLEKISKLVKKTLQQTPERMPAKPPLLSESRSPAKTIWRYPYGSEHRIKDTTVTVRRFMDRIAKGVRYDNGNPKPPPVKPKKTKAAKKGHKTALKAYQWRLDEWRERMKTYRKYLKERSKLRKVRIIKPPGKSYTKHPEYFIQLRQPSNPGQPPRTWKGKGWINYYLRKQWYSTRLTNGYDVHLGPNTSPDTNEWGDETFLHDLEYGGESYTNRRSPGYLVRWEDPPKNTTRSKREYYISLQTLPNTYGTRKKVRTKPRPFVSAALNRISQQIADFVQ